jgi:hypothetical protein
MDELSAAPRRGPEAAGQAEALRAYLTLDLGEAERIYGQLARAGGLDGFGELVFAAFVLAARRHFGPSWTRAEVIRFVSAFRARIAGQSSADIDPLASEMIIRAALGENAAAAADEETRTTAQIILLPELITALEPDDSELSELLAEAQAQASTLLSGPAGLQR